MSSSSNIDDVSHDSLTQHVEERMATLELTSENSNLERDKDEKVAVTNDQTSCSSGSSAFVEEKSSKNSSEGAKDDSQQVPQYSFPTPIMMEDLLSVYLCYQMMNDKSYNFGILALGVSNILSYVAYFCRYEARKLGFDVVSFGTDGSSLDQEIIFDYYKHFAEELSVRSVSANESPRREINSETLDELVKLCPEVASNCVLLLIWPEFAMSKEATVTEIDVIRKLQPRAVLTVYEVGGMCGSQDFHAYMRRDKDHPGWDRYENKDPGLDNYSMDEIDHQVVNFDPSKKVLLPALEFKMVKLKRSDCVKEDAVTSAPSPDEGIDFRREG